MHKHYRFTRLKELIGKLAGFDEEIQKYRSEIEDLRQKIEVLSWDDAFGMWTRNAFIQFCEVMPRGERVVVFLDMDDIHDLNHRHGYAEVDRRMRSTFSIPFRRSDIVARWYSGDEIVILFDSDLSGAERKVSQLETSAGQNGLSFQHEIGIWRVGERPITEIVDELSQQLKSHGGPREQTP